MLSLARSFKMYDHTKQMRCDFIRGKSQKEMDDMLPFYARTISMLCPCSREKFRKQFDAAIANQMGIDTGKTLANHRTETAGKLLGLWYEEEKMIYESDRNKKFLQDSDQPALFKDVCFKHQFPTGVQKMYTVKEKLARNIKFRPYPFILKLLQLVEERHISVTRKDLGYYVLNSEDVLTGRATVEDVIAVIEDDKLHDVQRKIPIPAGKESSYVFQHIREQFNYLELANLIYCTADDVIRLNHREDTAIERFVAEYGKGLLFDFSEYNLADPKVSKEVECKWGKYYGKLSTPVLENLFSTRVDAIIGDSSKITVFPSSSTPVSVGNLVELGDEGEEVVFKYEKARVKAFKASLVNRVLSLGKTRGLGYDIQSVVAVKGPAAEFSKYIEVKTTKRITAPDLKADSWTDNFNITRNEYLAACQHKELYSIYRVYFTREGISFYVIENIEEKIKSEKIDITPTVYRIEFSSMSVDDCISNEKIVSLINA